MGDKYYGMQVPIIELINNTSEDLLKIEKAVRGDLQDSKTDEQQDKAVYSLKLYSVKLVESLSQFTGGTITKYA